MILMEAYKAKRMGLISQDSLFASKLGKTMISESFNIWDEVWEVGSLKWQTGLNEPSSTMIRSTNYIPASENTTYYIKVSAKTNLFYYDENKGFISPKYMGGSGTFTTPSGCCYIRFSPYADYGTEYNNDICINVSKTEGSPKNGDYVPYKG